MDKDLAQTIRRLSLGEKVALMKFMHLIPDEPDDVTDANVPAARIKPGQNK